MTSASRESVNTDNNVIHNSLSDFSKINLPEATAVHLFHAPDNEDDMNGLTFIVKRGDQKVTVALREGESSNGNELPLGIAYDTGGEKYSSLLTGRHEQLNLIQNRINELSNAIFELFLDVKL